MRREFITHDFGESNIKWSVVVRVDRGTYHIKNDKIPISDLRIEFMNFFTKKGSRDNFRNPYIPLIIWKEITKFIDECIVKFESFESKCIYVDFNKDGEFQCMYKEGNPPCESCKIYFEYKMR